MDPKRERSFKPALAFHGLTRLYDPVMAWTMREEAFKGALVAQAGLQPGQQVLDLGCGTGTLTLMLKAHAPEAHITGLDADPVVLARAAEKAQASTMSLTFIEGMADDLPFDDAVFDHVVSSLFFHHLPPRTKADVLHEVHRVLKPQGKLHIADWGRPSGVLTRAAFYLVQLLDGFETTQDHVAGRLPGFIRAGGFEDIQEQAAFDTLFGTVRLMRATKP